MTTFTAMRRNDDVRRHEENNSDSAVRANPKLSSRWRGSGESRPHPLRTIRVSLVGYPTAGSNVDPAQIRDALAAGPIRSARDISMEIQMVQGAISALPLKLPRGRFC